MHLTPGTPAPAVTAQLWPEGELVLDELHGSPVWIAFFRFAGCQVANLRIHEMAERHEMLAACGLHVFAAVQSPGASTARFVGRHAPPFPVICDPTEGVFDTYGVGTSWRGMVSPQVTLRSMEAARHGILPGRPEGTIDRMPADFLIDEAGAIEVCYYGEDLADSIPFSLVDDFVLARA